MGMKDQIAALALGASFLASGGASKVKVGGTRKPNYTPQQKKAIAKRRSKNKQAAKSRKQNRK